jgi:hypothetical protein
MPHYITPITTNFSSCITLTLTLSLSLTLSLGESLKPATFRELLRRIFSLNLTNQEIGFIVRKFDKKRTGQILCAPFLSEFIRIGQVGKYLRTFD